MRDGCRRRSAAAVGIGLMIALVGQSGCGSDGASSSGQPRPLKDRDAIVAALPKGITLDSPIEPNPMLGPNSKTVEEALASLQAHVRDGKILDGGLGHEIRFQTGAGSKDAGGSARSARGKSAPATVITLKR